MIDVTFAEPRYLWLLIAPAGLLLLWAWRVAWRRVDLRRFARRRMVPVRERFAFAGDLSFWLFAVGALALLILALARPIAPTSSPQRAGVDLVVLQDASASMRVGDVGRAREDAGDPAIRDRWQRSMHFLRALGDALSWHQDRIAMTVFAHIAAPQIRLTRDPNTLFFFLDHLYERPPFRLEDDATWDTNLEQGVAWGLRLVEKDEELHGRSENAKVFVMLSDGETWSGEVARAIANVTGRGIPIHVVGVGTLGGGPLPIVKTADADYSSTPAVSRLERASLQRIAAAARGEYFELNQDADRYIANAIVASGRRLAPSIGLQETAEELYPWCLSGAAALAALGVVFVRRRAELAILLAGGAAAMVVLLPLLA